MEPEYDITNGVRGKYYQQYVGSLSRGQRMTAKDELRDLVDELDEDLAASGSNS